MRSMRPVCFLSILGGVVIGGLSARADTVAITPDRDNTIYQDSGAVSNGAGGNCFTGVQNFGLSLRALMRFDVASNVPSGSTVHCVTLTLYCSRTVSGAVPQYLHRVSANWGEGTSVGLGQGGIVTNGDATWFHTFFPSTNWATPGGDFDSVVSAATAVGAEGLYYTFGPTAMMTADVQSWLDQPQTNFGWMILGDESASGTAKRFDTRESLVPATRPILTIDFTPPATNPPADLNHDGVVNSMDRDFFVTVLLGLDTDACHVAAADVDHSGSVDGADIETFVGLVIP